MLCAELSKCIVHWLEMHLEWQILFFFRNSAQDGDNPKRQDKKEKRDDGKGRQRVSQKKQVVSFSTADWS